MISKGPEDQPVIYLTFDDGPDPRFTPRILDLLDFFQVPATFFVLGQASVRFPALLKKIYASGHSVGNHSHSHCHPWLIGDRRARQEVRRAYHVIADICSEPPRLFRPPHGRKRGSMLEEATSLGMETVLWSRSAVDWGAMADIDSIGGRLNRARAGDIILCHDAPRLKNHPEMTLAVLPAFIEDCQRRQLRFAALDELLPSPAPGRIRRPSLSPAQSV